MTLGSSLPDYLHLDNPTSNVAGLGAAPLPTWPVGQTYRAIDGTVIGRGIACDPITDEPYLSGLDDYGRAIVPDILSENRIGWGEDFALPLMIGSIKFLQSGSGLNAAAWALGGYMFPYGVAAWVAYNSYQAYQRRGPVALSGLGQEHGPKYRPGPWKTGRNCMKWKNTWQPDGTYKFVCTKYGKDVPPYLARYKERGKGGPRISRRDTYRPRYTWKNFERGF
jgi:hypothetical protein